MLKHKYVEELQDMEETKQEKKEVIGTALGVQTRLLGARMIRNSHFEKHVLQSNKFQKCLEQTRRRLIPNVDKQRVKEVFQSLRHVNRQILVKNKVEEADLVDDFIYLTIKMDREIMQK